MYLQVFAKINAISFKQARKSKGCHAQSIHSLCSIIWKTSTLNQTIIDVNFLVVSLTQFLSHFHCIYSPDFILMIKEGVNRSPHSNTPNFHTFVRSTGNQLCVTRTNATVSTCVDAWTFQCASQAGMLLVTDLTEPSSKAVTRICDSRENSIERMGISWPSSICRSFPVVSKYWWFHV